MDVCDAERPKKLCFIPKSSARSSLIAIFRPNFQNENFLRRFTSTLRVGTVFSPPFSVYLSLSNLSPAINFISGYHGAAVKEPTPRPYSVNVLIIDFVGNEGESSCWLYRRLLSLPALTHYRMPLRR
jgi:hypothetical protein